ncbi:ATP-binding protein [Dongia sedimenti]|uniref:histidine kinase n=1 Tax=Dongia sedimenti TaxID=3064282 RepID=A0ABU0YKY1_9PROT|nr:ATP-binding protein [Rhodospirillaceae bacterium R-7]
MQTPRAIRNWRRLFIVGLVLLAALVLWSAKELAVTVDTLRANELDNVGWNASQLEVQLVKLQHLLAEAKAGNPQRLLLQRRWDNLLSRVDPLDAAITPDLRASQPDFAPTFEQVKADIAEMSAYVRVRNGNLVQSVDVLEGPATALAVPIRRLAVMGDQYWGQLTERRRGALVDKIQSLALALGGLLLLLCANQIVIVVQRHRLGTMAVELKAALRAADQANMAKTNFLARMSHELRTPLNAIIGFAEVMQKEMFGPLGHPRYRDYSIGILASGHNLLGLVDSVLDVSRIEIGSVPVTRELVALDEMARSCVAAIQGGARNGAVEVANMVPEDLPPLRVDPAHLRKILLQLLDNAVKFGPNGGHVELGARRCDAGRLEIWVKDDGPGIRPEDLRNVLTPFNQVRNHLVFHHEGLGLGLPIAKSLTELNGGEFELTSAPGRGTEAKLRFDTAA